MNLQISKIIGCSGALLILLSIFTFTILFGFAVLIGSILVLISLYSLAKFYKDKEIFNSALYGALSTVIGIIISIIIIVVTPIWSTLKDNIYIYIPDWNGNWINLLNSSSKWGSVFSAILRQRGAETVLVLVVVWVFLIITMIFVRRSLKKLAKHSHNDTFATTGTMLIIGAAIPIIGLICIWLAIGGLAFAFFTTKEPNPTPSSTTEQLPSTQTILKTNSITKCYCPYCGNPILPENIFCPHCGQQE
jgi:uncharacterized membrane protein